MVYIDNTDALSVKNIFFQRSREQINIMTRQSQYMQVAIYSTTGQLVWLANESWEDGSLKQRSFTPEITPGFYIVKVATESGLLTKKIRW